MTQEGAPFAALPIASSLAQSRSKRGHCSPDGSSCVQPSDSPGVLSQKKASITPGRPVFIVGAWPAPAPRTLHHASHVERPSGAPLRPVQRETRGWANGSCRLCVGIRKPASPLFSRSLSLISRSLALSLALSFPRSLSRSLSLALSL
eukprot:7231743-Prymnesium_polylepis.1